MKNILSLLAGILFSSTSIFAQGNSNQTLSFGTVNQLFNELSQSSANSVKLTLADGSRVDAVIKYKTKSQNEIHLQGEIPGTSRTTFNLDIKNGKLEGRVFLPEVHKAYVYTDVNGNAVVAEADINKLLCVDFAGDEDAAGKLAQRPTTDPEVSNLQSNPGAGGCLLLDFDGYEMPAGNYWNGGNAISAATSGMSNEDILKAWEIVAQDFYPFNLNVTTNEAVFNTYPQNKRSRCVVTPTNYFMPGCQGIAFTNSFLFNNESPCWIFTTGTGLTGKRVGEASSHELGHTLGLSHDGGTNTAYYGGHGNWGPIMGSSLNKPVTQWSRGEYDGATNTEDDLAIIASPMNGVGYRSDDHQATLANATQIVHNGGTLTAGQNKGFIGRTNDVDAFAFTSTGGNTALVVKASTSYTDIRLGVTLYNSAGTVISTYIAPASDLSAPLEINTSLTPGIYYLVVTGTAAGTASADYNEYSSLGTYDIFGTFNNTPLGVSISPLNAKVVDEKQTLLTWNTYREQNNAGFKMQRSADGKNFSEIAFINPLVADGNSNQELQYNFTDSKSLNGTSFYRLIQTDKNGQASYSDIVSVTRTTNNNLEMIAYPNPSTSTLTVQLNGKLTAGAEIVLTDMSGRVVMKQPVATSKVSLDMSALQTGMYLLKYTGSENTLSCKVLKK